MSAPFHCIIMGAAGRDFHDFQTFFRERPQFRVRAFTAAQIPFIESRTFPQALAGPHYPSDIPIYPESQLPRLIRELEIDLVFLAYSDLSHLDVMHKASLVQSCGASFVLLGAGHTQLVPRKPVFSVTAVRTGAGKSPISQALGKHVTEQGYRVGVIRHPMPYGDLTRQAAQRIAHRDDLERNECTIEEREEFEPYLELGLTVFAGVDYRRILSLAEEESDVILWDGGNNDVAFVKPGLSIVVVDSLRPGQEVEYYPGETNLRSADILVINKVGKADPVELDGVRNRLRQYNSRAEVIEGDLEIHAESPELIAGRRVLVVEDGPTLTHGGMAFGAGFLAAQQHGAAELVDPRVSAVGGIARLLNQYPRLQGVLPAIGYSSSQCMELSQTIENSAAEVVVDASPARLDRLLNLSIPVVRVQYAFQQVRGPSLTERVTQFVRRQTPGQPS